MTEVKLSWTITTTETFRDTFVLEDLPADLRQQIEYLIEDGVVPYGDMMDFTFEEPTIDDVLSARESPEKDGQAEVESRYIDGVEFLPPTPPTRAAVGYTGITEEPDDLV